MDAEIVRVVDKMFRIVLIDQLETIVSRHLERLSQRLMDAVCDGPDMAVGFTRKQ